MASEPEVFDFDDAWGSMGGVASGGWAAAAVAAGPIAAIGSAVVRGLKETRERREEYLQLQYEYVSQRFFREEFEAFVAEIETLR